MQSIEYRYTHDPLVRALVDSLTKSIMDLQLTPSEIRECALLASIHYEQRKPSAINASDEICPWCNGFGKRMGLKEVFSDFGITKYLEGVENCKVCNGTGKL